MTRVGSHFTFCSPQRILRRMVVERDEQNIVTQLFSLDDNAVESAQTLFFDGILSSEIISVKQNVESGKIKELVRDYNYFDLSVEPLSFAIEMNDKPLLIDFGTNSMNEVNSRLAKLAQLNGEFPIFDLIASCVYFPALLLGREGELAQNCRTNLILWKNADLVNKRLKIGTHICEV